MNENGTDTQLPPSFRQVESPQVNKKTSINNCCTGIVDDALLRLGHRRRIALWLPYFATAATIVAKTDLILTMPSRAATELMRSSKLARFEPPLEIEGFDYRLLWHERSHADPGHKWLRDLIADTIS